MSRAVIYKSMLEKKKKKKKVFFKITNEHSRPRKLYWKKLIACFYYPTFLMMHINFKLLEGNILFPSSSLTFHLRNITAFPLDNPRFNREALFDILL